MFSFQRVVMLPGIDSSLKKLVSAEARAGKQFGFCAQRLSYARQALTPAQLSA